MQSLIQPYQAAWRDEFEKIKAVLFAALKDFAIDIQHIGSTVVPGLVAKPILDIDIIIHNGQWLPPITLALERLGYSNKGEQGIAGRFAFRQSSPRTPFTEEGYPWLAHHLYVCFADSLALKNHILFRDALLNDSALAGQYAELKGNLISQKGMTRDAYAQLKSEFILSVLKGAGLNESELSIIRGENT